MITGMIVMEKEARFAVKQRSQVNRTVSLDYVPKSHVVKVELRRLLFTEERGSDGEILKTFELSPEIPRNIFVDNGEIWHSVC